MKTRNLLLAAVLLGGAASAQDTLLDYVTESCKDDMAKYCSTVTPGEGRMLYCAAAHEDKLSTQCEGALVDAAMILTDLTDIVVGVAEACATELDKFCGDVEVGEGRVLACLDEHDDALGDSCEAALDALEE